MVLLFDFSGKFGRSCPQKPDDGAVSQQILAGRQRYSTTVSFRNEPEQLLWTSFRLSQWRYANVSPTRNELSKTNANAGKQAIQKNQRAQHPTEERRKRGNREQGRIKRDVKMRRKQSTHEKVYGVMQYGGACTVVTSGGAKWHGTGRKEQRRVDGAFESTDRALAMTRGQWMGDSRVLGHLFRPRETLTSRQWAHALTVCVFALCSRHRGHPKCRSAVSINQIFDGEIGTSLAWNRFDSLGRPRRQALSGGHAVPAIPSAMAWAHTRRRPIEPHSFSQTLPQM